MTTWNRWEFWPTSGRCCFTTSSALEDPTRSTMSLNGPTRGRRRVVPSFSMPFTLTASTCSATPGEQSSRPSAPSANRSGSLSLILADPCLSMPRFMAACTALRAGLPAEVRAVLDRHEAAGTTDSAEYQAAAMEFYGRYVCLLDPWPDVLVRLFSEGNAALAEHVRGNLILPAGTHKDYDATSRLHELAIPTLFLCGRHDISRPEETAWYRSLVPGAELVVFEQSSHMPHLEEPDHYLNVLRDFLHRADNYSPRSN